MHEAGNVQASNAQIVTVDINVIPTAADNTVTVIEDNQHVFASVEFLFADADGGALSMIMITGIESVGTLYLDATTGLVATFIFPTLTRPLESAAN